MFHKIRVIITLSLLANLANGQPAKDVIAFESSTNLEDSMSSYFGRVEPIEIVNQLAPFPGQVVRQIASVSSRVEAGQPILVVAQRSMGEVFSNYTVKANIAGILDEYVVAPGADFSTNAALFTILDTSLHRVDLSVSNKDIHQIKPGQTVYVKPEGHTKQYVGKVRRRSLSPIGGSALYAVRIEIPATIPIGSFCEVLFSKPSKSPPSNGKSKTGSQPRGHP